MQLYIEHFSLIPTLDHFSIETHGDLGIPHDSGNPDFTIILHTSALETTTDLSGPLRSFSEIGHGLFHLQSSEHTSQPWPFSNSQSMDFEKCTASTHPAASLGILIPKKKVGKSPTDGSFNGKIWEKSGDIVGQCGQPWLPYLLSTTPLGMVYDIGFFQRQPCWLKDLPWDFHGFGGSNLVKIPLPLVGYVCVYMYIYIYMYTCEIACVHVYMYVYMYTCIDV